MVAARGYLTRVAARPSLRRAHAISAGVVGSFALVHLANHVAALGGVEVHIAFMRAARVVYRQPIAEALLLACVAFQVASGAAMLLQRRAWPRARIARVQAVAGLVLAAFLAIHVSAVLAARITLGLDTNFYFAAAGLRAGGAWPLFFVPYYAAGVFALVAHLGAALRRRDLSTPIGWRMLWLVGAVMALAIIGCLAGVWIDVDVPMRYRATFG